MWRSKPFGTLSIFQRSLTERTSTPRTFPKHYSHQSPQSTEPHKPSQKCRRKRKEKRKMEITHPRLRKRTCSDEPQPLRTLRPALDRTRPHTNRSPLPSPKLDRLIPHQNSRSPHSPKPSSKRTETSRTPFIAQNSHYKTSHITHSPKSSSRTPPIA